jgi:DNA mismatch endonuclease (patch repair protein)
MASLRPSTPSTLRGLRITVRSDEMHSEMHPDVAPATRRTMQANRGRDTGPELALRSILHARGLRFRVNQPLPFDRRRRADLTFTRVGLYVFVDGCFWHGCPEHFVAPKTRNDFWLGKIRGNRVRDAETTRRLEELGATVVRGWEHEDPAVVADAVETAYRSILMT